MLLIQGRANGNVRTDQANTWTTGAQSLAAAASLLVPTSAGYAPTADGSIGYDSTQDKTVLGGAGGLAGSIPRVLSVQLGASDTLAAATIGTTETAFATVFALPANYFQANKLVRVTVGFELTSSASAPTFQLRARLQKTGPVNVNLYVGVANNPTVSLTAVGCGVQFYCQGTAAPGAAVNIETFLLTHNGLAGPAFPMSRNSQAQPVAADTASAQTIQLTLQFGAATAGNSVTLRQLIVEELN